MIAFSSQHDFLFKAIGKEADDLNLPCYVVGGWVRDQLLKRPNSKDIDFVVVGDALDVAKRCSKTLGGSKVTLFKKFGTAQFRWKDWDIEFVQARTESYTSDSRNPAVAPGTLRDDQLRRDFTINAMAMGVNQDNFGQLLDPFDGQSDLKKGIIRTPLNPQETFDDDPLRMMRAVRFASQLGFTIDDQTLKGIQGKANRMAILSSDRIHVELNKIMESKVPSVGLTWMHKGGLMPHVLPEIAALEGVDEVDGHLHKDNFWHSLEVLDNLARVSDKLWHRWAALLHDIGKPVTKRFKKGSGWTFHGHEFIGGKMAKKLFRRLSMPMDARMKYVVKLIQMSSRPIAVIAEEVTDGAVRRLLFDAGDDIDDLMQLGEADITTKNGKRKQRYLKNFNTVRSKIKAVEAKDKLRNWQPPVNGNQLMQWFDLPPGKAIGDLKTAIREGILDGDIANDFDDAKAFAFQWAKNKGYPLKP
ncbi:MAG: HD domain-containing protein [Bacteroidetes bacterium]|nr:HD domain-containing protein [Bacteroidota bacterium]